MEPGSTWNHENEQQVLRCAQDDKHTGAEAIFTAGPSAALIAGANNFAQDDSALG